MSIIDLSVKRYQFTIVIFFALVALGMSAFFSISRSEDPQITFAGSVITAIYPGASPRDIEELVVTPIEEKITALDNLKTIKSTIEDGLAVIMIEFKSGEDPEKKYDEIQRELNLLRPTLPPDVFKLDVKKISPTDVNIIQIALMSSDASYLEMEAHGERLRKSLKRLEGIKDAFIHSSPSQELRISLDLALLSQKRISVGQVIQAIESENSVIPAGSIDIGRKKFNVKTKGQYASLSEVEQTIIGSANGQLLRLGDIADVSFDYEEQSGMARHNGMRAIFVTTTLKSGANIFPTREGIAEALSEFTPTLPPSMTLEIGFDQAKNVDRRLSGLYRDFIIAIFLVLITLLPLGFRASLVVMVSIPLSLLMGVFMLSLFGYNINQLSIVGFVIALGLLVDDSIVVVENTTRLLRQGLKPIDAAIQATKQISVAVIGATVTLILAFLPLAFLPGNPGQYIRSLPVAVVVTVFSSLIVSLTIVPFLSSKLLKEESEDGNVMLQWLTRFINWSYGRVLDVSLSSPKTTLLIALSVFLISLLTIPLIGFSLFPKAGIPQFLISIETPEGSSLDETERAVHTVEAMLQGSDQIAWMSSSIGRGNPRIYYNIFPKEEKSTVGEIFAEVKQYNEKQTTLFFDSLRSEFARYPGARIELKEFENGPPIDAPIAIRIQGDNLDTLTRLASDISELIKTVDGTIYVTNPVQVSKTDVKVDLDYEKAGLYLIPIAEAKRTVRMAIAGLHLGRFRKDNGDDIPIRLTSAREGRPTLESLHFLHLGSLSGLSIPLDHIASVYFESSPTTITHVDEVRTVTITSYVRSGYNTDLVSKAIIERLDGIHFPNGYRYTPAGEIKSRQESFGGFGTIILIASFGIFAVLVLEFGSFRSTLIVFSVVPLGVVGGLIGLLLSGYTLSFTAVIGFIALLGIEIKTSILLVDFTNALRQKGVSLQKAIRDAGEVRFVPVLLTSVTAIGGLLPIALQGSGLYSPLAIVIIGGLLSSTLLARLVTPVMYQLLPPDIEVSE